MSMVISTVFHAEFNGSNGIGTISVPGLKQGDIMLTLQQGSGSEIQMHDPIGSQFYWDQVVAVDDQLQQSSVTDYSGVTFKAVFFRGS